MRAYRVFTDYDGKGNAVSYGVEARVFLFFWIPCGIGFKFKEDAERAVNNCLHGRRVAG